MALEMGNWLDAALVRYLAELETNLERRLTQDELRIAGASFAAGVEAAADEILRLRSDRGAGSRPN